MRESLPSIGRKNLPLFLIAVMVRTERFSRVSGQAGSESLSCGTDEWVQGNKDVETRHNMFGSDWLVQ